MTLHGFDSMQDTCLTTLKDVAIRLLYLLLVAFMIGILYWAFAPEAQAEEIDIVIETIALESSSESIEAQVMVAQVILTRAEEWNMTLKEVVLQPYQFSCHNKNIRGKMKKRTQKELQIARKALKQARSSMNSLPAVTHYYSGKRVPYWASSMKFVCQIDRLRFYYEERS